MAACSVYYQVICQKGFEMMKKIFNDEFRIIIILSFVLNLILFSGVFAEENNVQRYNTDVVTGFDPKAYEIVIETEYKYSLIE